MFIALRASARNCTFSFSESEAVLNTEISQFTRPGPRIPMVRVTLPSVNAGASMNAALLIQLSILCANRAVNLRRDARRVRTLPRGAKR